MLNCQNGIAFWRILTLRPLPLTAVCAFPAIVEKITKQTENPFVNLYLVEGTNKVNHHFRYYVASRAKSIEQMKIKTRKNTPDGVLMYSLYGEKRDKIVLVRQYRVSIDDYIYEFPAGLVEPGRTII